MKLRYPGQRQPGRQRIAAYNLKIPCERCLKTTDGKAVGDTQTDGFALSPYVAFSWTAFVGMSN
jgi:hypothetical protein